MFKNGIVLTGGIATGKSTVASLMQLLGFRVIDADKIAHKILDNSVDKIKDEFGVEFIDSSNRVDRKALGKLIFSNKDKRERLEAILHPKIKRRGFILKLNELREV